MTGKKRRQEIKAPTPVQKEIDRMARHHGEEEQKKAELAERSRLASRGDIAEEIFQIIQQVRKDSAFKLNKIKHSEEDDAKEAVDIGKRIEKYTGAHKPRHKN